MNDKADPDFEFALPRTLIHEAWRLEPLQSALHRRDFAEAEDQRRRNSGGFSERVDVYEARENDGNLGSRGFEHMIRYRLIVDMLDRIAPMIAASDAPSAIVEIEAVIFTRIHDHVARAYSLTPKPFAKKADYDVSGRTLRP